MYVGLEIEDRIAAIDTLTNRVIASVAVGQAPQAVVYVPNAVPEGPGTLGLQPLGLAGEAAKFILEPVGEKPGNRKAPTSVTLFDQGLVQMMEASVTGLEPRRPYVLGLASQADGSGRLEPLEAFMTNPAGAAIVNAIGPIRQIVQGSAGAPRRYLVIAPGSSADLGKPVQVQAD